METKYINIILVIMWIIIGTIDLLISPTISKINFACVWIVLIVKYIFEILEDWGK